MYRWRPAGFGSLAGWGCRRDASGTSGATVQKGGRIEVVLPDFMPGEHVRVKVERETPRRAFTFGLAKNKIKMSEDFDAPLDEFQDFS